MKTTLTTIVAIFFSGVVLGQQDTILIDLEKNNTTSKDSIIKGTVNNKVKTGKTNTYVIEYDFKSGVYNRNNNKLKVNTPVVYKITNINRLAYDVKVTAKDSVLGYSQLEGIYEMFKKEKTATLKEEVKTAEQIVSASPAISASVEKTDLILKETDAIVAKNVINAFNSEVDSLTINAFVSLQKGDEIKPLETLKLPDVNTTDKKANIILKNHMEAQLRLTNVYLNIVQKFHVLLGLSKEYLNVSDIMHDPLLNLETLLSKENVDGNLIKSTYNNFNSNKTVSSELNILIKQFTGQYNALKNNRELGEIANFGGVIKMNYVIEAQNTEVLLLKEQLEHIDFDKLRTEISEFKRFFDSGQCGQIFEYVSYPIQPYQDVAVFDIEIKKKRTANGIYQNNRKFSHKEFTKEGLRLDVSIGVAGSIHGKKYDVKLEQDLEGNNKIVEGNESVFTPSFVGFFTATKRSANHWAVGFSVGVGVSADEGRVAFDNFFVGPSLMIGKYERVTVTAGASLKYLPSLKASFEDIENDTIPNQYTLDNIADYSYRAGVFLAVSYNLTRGVRDNVKHLKSFVP